MTELWPGWLRLDIDILWGSSRHSSSGRDLWPEYSTEHHQHNTQQHIIAVCINIICIRPGSPSCPCIWWPVSPSLVTAHYSSSQPQPRILKFVCTGILQHKPVASSYFLTPTTRCQIHFSSIQLLSRTSLGNSRRYFLLNIRDFSEEKMKDSKFQSFLVSLWLWLWVKSISCIIRSDSTEAGNSVQCVWIRSPHSAVC